jgi:co-chaperonin GroES (HSP10)
LSTEKEEYVAKHFPEVEPGCSPCGAQILVQLRTMQKKSAGGILLANETTELNQQNTRVCRLIRVGNIAFRNRETGQLWREGVWAQPGDIIIMPAWGGFRFEVPIPGTEDRAVFATYSDHEVKLVVNSNFEAFDKLL